MSSCPPTGPALGGPADRLQRASNSPPSIPSGTIFRLMVVRRLLDSPPARGMTPVVTLSLLAKHALRVEVADAAALRAGCRVDHRVDQRRLAGVHGLVHGAFELVRRRRVHANAAERLHHLVVTRVLDEDSCRNVRTAGRIDVGPAINAVVVE